MDFTSRIIISVFVVISLFVLLSTTVGGPTNAIEKQLKK